MILYHEASPDSVTNVLKEGLKKTSQGEKSDDELTKRTNALLDEHRPLSLKTTGVSRSENVYVYYAENGKVYSIVDRKFLPIEAFIKRSNQTVLAITVDPGTCFVSDHDRFDELKDAIHGNKVYEECVELARNYWNHVVPLNDFSLDLVPRPEVMITSSVPSSSIELA